MKKNILILIAISTFCIAGKQTAAQQYKAEKSTKKNFHIVSSSAYASSSAVNQGIIISRSSQPCPITKADLSLSNVTNCSGTPCDGSASVILVTGGTGTYTYLWSNGQTGATVSGLCPGSANVQITDGSGNCTYTHTFTILKGKQQQLPARDSLYFNVWTKFPYFDLSSGQFWTCDCVEIWQGDKNNSGPSGIGVVNYSTGGGPYIYTWSSNIPGTTNSPGKYTFCPASTTSYTLTVSDAACITLAIAPTVYVRSPPAITVSKTDVTTVGACDGQAAVSVTTGTSPYTYLWTPTSKTTQTISSLCPNTYTVTVTDKNQCPSTKTTTINDGVSTAVPSIQKIPILDAFPNPAQSLLHIFIAGDDYGELNIVNTLGQILFSDKTEQGIKEIIISIEQFPSGMYFLEYSTQKRKMYKKIIKE